MEGEGGPKKMTLSRNCLKSLEKNKFLGEEVRSVKGMILLESLDYILKMIKLLCIYCSFLQDNTCGYSPGTEF